MKTLQELTRPNIWKLKPYSSARDEYKGYTASVFLDANENPYNTPHNRYPDPTGSRSRRRVFAARETGHKPRTPARRTLF